MTGLVALVNFLRYITGLGLIVFLLNLCFYYLLCPFILPDQILYQLQRLVVSFLQLRDIIISLIEFIPTLHVLVVIRHFIPF